MAAPPEGWAQEPPPGWNQPAAAARPVSALPDPSDEEGWLPVSAAAVGVLLLITYVPAVSLAVPHLLGVK